MLTTTAREIKNLKMLNHENIVPLLEMIVERKAGQSRCRGVHVRARPDFPALFMRRRIRGQYLPGLSVHGTRPLRVYSFDRVDFDCAELEGVCCANARRLGRDAQGEQ